MSEARLPAASEGQVLWVPSPPSRSLGKGGGGGGRREKVRKEGRAVDPHPLQRQPPHPGETPPPKWNNLIHHS